MTPSAGFARRAAALLYDALIIFALQMLYTAIAIIPARGPTLSLPQVPLRAATAPLAWLPAGLGVLWLHVNPERLALQDRWSGTRVELTPRKL